MGHLLGAGGDRGETRERGRGGGGSWEVDIPAQPLQTSPLHSKRITLFSQRETTRNVCSVVLSHAQLGSIKLHCARGHSLMTSTLRGRGVSPKVDDSTDRLRDRDSEKVRV